MYMYTHFRALQALDSTHRHILLSHNGRMHMPHLKALQHRSIPKRDLIPQLNRISREPDIDRRHGENEPQHLNVSVCQWSFLPQFAQRVPSKRREEQGLEDILGRLVVVSFVQLQREDGQAESERHGGASDD